MVDVQEKFKAIIGLGNPGSQFTFQRHNIGFMVIDALASQFGSTWKQHDKIITSCHITVQDQTIFLIKPLTFMNSSGTITPWLVKKNISAKQLIVIHDDLELPFGKIAIKHSGSARGHNGLRSLIQHMGPDFTRVRCGIGRPEKKEEVPDYVLSNFIEGKQAVDTMINNASAACLQLITSNNSQT